jgi:hypothetical protein
VGIILVQRMRKCTPLVHFEQNHLRGMAMKKLFLPILLLTTAVTLAACAGGVVNPKPEFTPAAIQGQYEIIATSIVNPGSATLVEVNFTQSMDRVRGDKPHVVVIRGTQSPDLPITLNSVGAECDNGAAGNDFVEGIFSSPTEMSFTMTEAGSLGTGTATANVTVSPDGKTVTTGTYTSPAQCGFAADNGNLTGVAVKPFSGRYAGEVSDAGGTAHSMVFTLNQNGSNLTIAGTDNGTTSFTLAGTVIGATFDVSGSIAGTPVRYIGRYLAPSDSFLVYDSTLAKVGVLGGGS